MASVQPNPTRATPAGGGNNPVASPASWDLSHVTFSDVLNDINPLQYLPGVGMLYRAITGQKVHPALNIAVAAASSLLLGGPVGLAATMLTVTATELFRSGIGSPTATSPSLACRAYRHTSQAA